MSINYAKNLPRDVGGAAMQGYPANIPALARYHRENAVTSSVISLNPNTTAVEIATIGGHGIAMRWVPVTENASIAGAKASIVASGLGANFDHVIPAGTYRSFVVPRETQGAMTGQAGSVHGLYQRIAWINAGPLASSILASEF